MEQLLKQRNGEESSVAHEVKDGEGMPGSYTGPDARNQLGHVTRRNLGKIAHLEEVLRPTLDTVCISTLSVQKVIREGPRLWL
jgi:hypothetical protein